jgi:tetratricopeptide (TPR) repeat protein
MKFPTLSSCISIGAQIGLIAGVVLIYFAYPVIYVRLIAEDNWGEYATFVALMIACFLFSKLFVSSHAKKRDLWFALLALGTFIVAMEEISWGQRIVGAPTPDILRVANFQGEITLHNIPALSPEALTYFLVSLGFSLYGFVLPVLAAVSSRINTAIARVNLPLPSLHLAPLFLATSYFLNFSSLAKGEEIGELFIGISLGCLALDRALSVLQLKKREKWKKWFHNLAIPVCIVASLSIGAQLVFFWGSTGAFKKRLNQLAAERLPAKKHFRQAEAVFAYLERNPELADENWLINKSKLLTRMGRVEEGRVLFEDELDNEMRLYDMNPNDPETLRRISLIHSALGNEGLCREYLHKSFEAYEVAMKAKNSRDEKAPRRSRLAWTYLIWSGKQNPKRKHFEWHIFRAETYEALEEYNKSIGEFLRAVEFANTSNYRKKIKYGVGRVLSKCRSRNESPSGRVPWNEVEAMARDIGENDLDWCHSEVTRGQW